MGFARFWEVDLHFHTPASLDVNGERYGARTAEEIVQAAIDAGIDAIAITDHNTTAWCDRVSEAADGQPIIVLPGVEISTTEGHLLAIWEQGTPSKTIDEVLVRLGISGDDQGKLDIAAEVGFEKAAEEISAHDGLAIAAHIDRAKGLLKLGVAANVSRILNCESLAAVEIVDLATATEVENKLQRSGREMACVRGSDATVSGSNLHVVKGVGSRRTWIKAARPDLVGIRHALQDPTLRVLLEQPAETAHPVIESVRLDGGFLDGVVVDLSPDLNCLLGGTGVGKSLLLEAIRFALRQQASATSFPAIAKEVRSRLVETMGESGVVNVTVRTGSQRYKVRSAIGTDMDGAVSVFQELDDEWVEIELAPADVLPIAAFSQGEALEFARESVGRMSLVDAGLNLATLNDREIELVDLLTANATVLIEQQALVNEIADEVRGESGLSDRVAEISELFETDLVQQQNSWTTERSKLGSAVAAVPTRMMAFEIPELDLSSEVDGNSDLFRSAADAINELRLSLERAVEQVETAMAKASSSISESQSQWTSRFEEFKHLLESELEKHGDGASLVGLRAQLEKLQAQLVAVRSKKDRLASIEQPQLETILAERERLLGELHGLRAERRQLRRDRVAVLNKKTAGIVKLNVPGVADVAHFRQGLGELKVGSRARDAVLDSIADSVHPFQFVRDLFAGDLGKISEAHDDIDASTVSRLLSNVTEKGLWKELLALQACPMPDRLSIKFKKPDDGTYAAVEHLAHGQRCTAVLVVLLADGEGPVIVDQPEDALHAPWIEEYLVDRLRGLRGERQYLFATRSPGIVVGADSEQIVTMDATSGRGQVQAAGSLERHDLNELALHHLEGGAGPFRRRKAKLDVSVASK